MTDLDLTFGRVPLWTGNMPTCTNCSTVIFPELLLSQFEAEELFRVIQATFLIHHQCSCGEVYVIELRLTGDNMDVTVHSTDPIERKNMMRRYLFDLKKLGGLN